MTGSQATDAQAPPLSGGALRVVREPEVARWSAFVDGHPHASIFHTPEMHRVFEETRLHRPRAWAAIDGAGGVRALLTPVEIATLGGPLRALTTRAVAFAGPLVGSERDGAEALGALLSGYRRSMPRSILFTEIRHVTDPQAVLPSLAPVGFRHEDHLNFLVDLTPAPDELWGRIASSARRNVQKARRMGVTVEEASDDADIAEGYEVLRDVYRRIQVPLPDRSLFDAAHRILAPLGRFRVLLAHTEGRTIGVLTLLRYKDVATYWYTGTLRDYATHRAGDLLVWRAIEWAREQGCRVLDFGGAGRPDEPYGVRDFKAKYGGTLVDFGRDVLVPSPVRFRLTTSGYELVRRFL